MILLDKLADLECTGPVFDQNLRMLAGTPRRALCRVATMDHVTMCWHLMSLKCSKYCRVHTSFLSRRRHAALNNALCLVSVLAILRSTYKFLSLFVPFQLGQEGIS